MDAVLRFAESGANELRTSSRPCLRKPALLHDSDSVVAADGDGASGPSPILRQVWTGTAVQC